LYHDSIQSKDVGGDVVDAAVGASVEAFDLERADQRLAHRVERVADRALGVCRQ
jgi:hypothetical protein